MLLISDYKAVWFGYINSKLYCAFSVNEKYNQIF